MNFEQILKEKYDFERIAPSKPSGVYLPVKQIGNFLFVSGHTPKINGELQYKGKVGTDLSIEEGQKAAQLAALNCLVSIKACIGDLARIKSFAQVVGYVKSSEGFTEQPTVINGASSLFIEIFGDLGKHSRAAVGANELPGGAAVEIMCIVEVSFEE